VVISTHPDDVKSTKVRADGGEEISETEPPEVPGGFAAPPLHRVPGPEPEQNADAVPRPVVTVESVPAEPRPGDEVDVLVTVSNPERTALTDLWLGLVLPPGVGMAGVTPPLGGELVTERTGRCQLVRCRLAALGPGGCTGLDVVLALPHRTGTHLLTAFLSVGEEPGPRLTCQHVLDAGATVTVPLRVVSTA
jgi:hypothetical protein